MDVTQVSGVSLLYVHASKPRLQLKCKCEVAFDTRISIRCFHSLVKRITDVLLMSTLHVRGSERWNSLFAHPVGETFNYSASVSRPE